MKAWQVRNVMTTEVITAPDDASVAEIVALLSDRQITAVAVVDSSPIPAALALVAVGCRHDDPDATTARDPMVPYPMPPASAVWRSR